ncbi:DUF1641 domain-containing protein [Pyrobaculum calidifontis]|uniref:DUF1641 domain-containing protein n=1 Tax=Pyrobaculum calidifontis (strain DSM 21063 / JCM 11548 / VA1) TaxID=410359 RepID=A3MUF9_PYRCJ|nr:DUF1641 domain-containing protein [Pyrobaculum calidifontis]ABO08276.1 protein of unknown function DUF1641 [Pyrobaculum calidifontis JCM 11548]
MSEVSELVKELRSRWIATERVVATAAGKSKPVLPDEVVLQHLKAAAEFLVRSGTLDVVVELLATLAMLQDVVTDRMVDEWARNLRKVGLLADSLTRTSLLEVLSNALLDVELERAILEVKDGKKISLITLISLFNDQEVRQGLYIVLKLLKALGKATKTLE